MTDIRRAAIGDAPMVAELIDALLVEISGAPSRRAQRQETARNLLAQKDQIFAFLAFDDEKPVGVMSITEVAAVYAEGNFGVITELYVVPEHRSDGIARRMVDTARGLGRDRGWRVIEVTAPSQPKWQRTLNFYERLGFSQIGPRLKISP